MRIAHVCPNYGIVRGGVERVIDQVAPELARRGHDVVVLSGGKETATDRHGVLHLSSPPLLAPMGFGFNLKMMRTLASLEPDIIHVHMNAPIALELASVVSLFKRKPVVASYNADPVASDIAPVRGLSDLLESAYSTMIRIECSHFSRIFVLTPLYPALSKVLKHVSRRKILVAPPGCDHILPHVVPRSTARRVLGLAGHEKVIIFVGRLVKYKGVGMLMHSVAILKRRQPKTTYKLLIVGDGREFDALQKLASLLRIEQETTFITG